MLGLRGMIGHQGCSLGGQGQKRRNQRERESLREEHSPSGIVMLDFLGLRNIEPVMFCSGILFFADSQDLNLYRLGETRGLDPLQLEAITCLRLHV